MTLIPLAPALIVPETAFFIALLNITRRSSCDAIFSATKTASELIEKQDDLGTIGKGKFADIIAVPGNPLQKIEVLEEVVFVMKNGEIYKNLTK